MIALLGFYFLCSPFFCELHGLIYKGMRRKLEGKEVTNHAMWVASGGGKTEEREGVEYNEGG